VNVTEIIQVIITSHYKNIQWVFWFYRIFDRT